MLLTVHESFVVYASHLLEVHGTGSHHCRVANSRCNAGVHAIAQLGYMQHCTCSPARCKQPHQQATVLHSSILLSNVRSLYTHTVALRY